MKTAFFSLTATFLIVLLTTTALCQLGTKGQQRILAPQGKSAENTDADAPPERFGFLLGKTLMPGFGGSVKASAKAHESYGVMPLGILRRVPQQYTTIQAGINASVHGDTVLVSEGTYFENIDYSGKRIIIASLYLLDHDTSHISRTIIDGSQAIGSGSVVSFISGEDTNSVLCGFTVRGGSGTDIPPTFQQRDGGGVLLWESSGRLVRNIITGNGISAPNAGGGGVSASGSTNTGQTLIMENNIVSRNIAAATSGVAFGGGVSVYQSQFRLTGNVFEFDTARGVVQAGASGVFVYFGSGNVGIVGGNVFRNNIVLGDSSSYACLAVVQYNGGVVIDGNVFEDNSVMSTNLSAYGGAMYIDDYNTSLQEKRITRNVLRRNRQTSSLRYSWGGTMILWDARVRVAENLIQDNFSQAGSGAYGGGIYGISWGGSIENNIITRNTSTNGGGIGHQGPPPSGATQMIMNNTVCNNLAEIGGGFYDRGFGTTSILLNNIFWDDSSSTGEIYAAGSIEVHNSNIEGGWIGGTGNINADPRFADTLYRLRDLSPCIGAGRDSMQIAGTWYRSPTRDFDGNSRPMPSPSRPDMGAWENPRGIPTGVADGREDLPAVLELSQNYPNPFNPSTTIRFSIPVGTDDHTLLRVFDVLGREVATLVNEIKKPGVHTIQWDASGSASGTYFYRIQTGGFAQTKKLIFLR